MWPTIQIQMVVFSPINTNTNVGIFSNKFGEKQSDLSDEDFPLDKITFLSPSSFCKRSASGARVHNGIHIINRRQDAEEILIKN